MIPKTERLLKYTELHVVSYGIDYVARTLLLFFSSENQLLWFRYREYDLAHLKLVFEPSIYKVWKSVRYGVSKELDTAYWGFLRVGTTLDIFQNIIFVPYIEYGALSIFGYGVLSFILCGKLNHLSGADKVNLSTAVNLWTRNIVIRQRVEDLQLEDYTIVHKTRAVIYRDRNDQKKMMRVSEVHKFSDGTLMRILENLDYIVKDYKLFKFNPGMERRIWTEDDKRSIIFSSWFELKRKEKPWSLHIHDCTTPAVHATEDSPAVPEQTTVETVMNMTPENRAHFESEKEVNSFELNGIGREIYHLLMHVSSSRNVGSHRKAYNKRAVNVVGARETVGGPVVQQSGIQCFNCKEFGHYAKDAEAKRLRTTDAEPLDRTIGDSNVTPDPQDIMSQSIQTIHMLAPKCHTFNGRPTFANSMYLKKAQNEKPCLYEIPHDQSDPANRLVPDREEILTLEEESRSKLNKDLVKPYDYTKLNSLYENFKPPNQEYLVQLAHANEIRKKMWRKSFVKTKPNIFKNIAFLPVSKSISKSRQAYNVMTNNINHLRELVDQACVKHSKDHFRAPTAQDMEILIKTCLMPLALKTRNDSFGFVYELKKEIHADLKYVESLKNEIDELESDKAEFSNMYDMLLQEFKECDCLAQKLSKQTEFVSKEVYTELLRSFAKLEKHSISLELALQQCQEQMKNDTVCKEKASNVFQKEREQYFEIQDLKAQLQDKNIAICELKKLIDKCKGKSVETKFDKPSVIRQPNAQRIPKPSVLGKPAPFSDSLERKNFPKKKSVPKTNESEGLSKPVTSQNLPQTATQAVRNTNVIKPGMYRIDSSTTKTRAPQLPQTYRNTNPRVSTSTGVAHRTNVSRPQPRSTQMKDKVVPNTSQVKFKKTEVEDHHRISSISNQTKSVTACNDSLKSRTSNVNAVCATCGKCVFNSNHDACVYKFLNDVNARTKKPNVAPISTRKPKSQANKFVATPRKKTVASDPTITNSKSYYRMLYEKTSKAWKWWRAQQCPSRYKWVPKTKMKWVPKVRNETVKKRVSFAIDNVSRITNIVQLILFIVDSGCTKHMTGNLSILCNFVDKYLGTVRFGNDQFAPILGYGDFVQGNITINRVYYVEGLNHNLFSVGQFCDADLEVAFRKSTCFVKDLQGNNLLTGNRGSDLYTISFQETTSSTPICLMAKASPTQAWLWHRRLSHLNFDYINLLSKKDVVIGLPKLKYVKDQLCSSCEVSKAKRSSFKAKTVPSSKGQLNLLHIDLCGPMRVASINGKKYILVIVDDYSSYTWTLTMIQRNTRSSKDETPEVLKDFLTMIQRNLQAPVISVRTDKGTEFLNKTLNAFFNQEGIKHQTSTP
ncbi:retrovirus-related pol polyprotein from transposon TNT 1-94 [Tanacetum coccineum]